MRFQCQILYWGLNIILFILSTAINTRHFYFQFTNEENKDKRFNNKLASKFHSQDWNLDLSNCELELCCLPPHPPKVKQNPNKSLTRQILILQSQGWCASSRPPLPPSVSISGWNKFSETTPPVWGPKISEQWDSFPWKPLFFRAESFLFKIPFENGMRSI